MAIIEAIAAPLIGGLISGLFGSNAAAPAAQGAQQSAQAQADMINALIHQYTTVFAPAQQQYMGQYQGLTSGLPTQDMANFQILQDLLPVLMPDIIKNRAQFDVQRGMENQMTSANRAYSQRGLAPDDPFRMAGINRIREQGVLGQAGLASNNAAWEAQQTMANQRNAYTDMLNMLGLGAQFSQTGNAMPGTAIQGAGQLTQQLSGAAQNAAQPWQNFGTSVSQALANYFATPQGAPGSAPLPPPPTYSPNPTPGWSVPNPNQYPSSNPFVV